MTGHSIVPRLTDIVEAIGSETGTGYFIVSKSSLSLFPLLININGYGTM